MRQPRPLRILLPVLFVLLVSAPDDQAHAHARATSFSYWEQDGERLNGRIVFPWVEAQQAFPQWRSSEPEDVLASSHETKGILQYFRDRVFIGGQDCDSAQWSGPRLQDGNLIFEAAAVCRTVSSIRFDLVFDTAPSHVHLVRFERPGQVLTGVVTSAGREWIVDAGSDDQVLSGFVSFVEEGFRHILGGWDHLVFLLALLLLAPSLSSLAALATGFTLAHSVSLAVAVLGLARPHGGTIEALIGFTVAFSGLEVFATLAQKQGDQSLLRRLRAGYFAASAIVLVAAVLGAWKLRAPALVGIVVFTNAFLFAAGKEIAWRWLLVFLFGFIHGFGFAGPLMDLSLSSIDLAKGLVGFNVGVELGQLAFLLLAWPIVGLLSRGERRVPVESAIAALVLAAGMQWFLLRALNW